MRDLANLLEDVLTFERKKHAFGEHVRKKDPALPVSDNNVVEFDLLHRVSVDDLHNRTVVGVDGGLIKRELHGLDLVLTRAVGVAFTYEDGKLTKHTYIPKSNPTPSVEVIRSPMERHDFQMSASLIRMKEEAQILLQALDEDPDLLLLDGSIVPHYADKPAADSRARDHYDALIKTYQELYTRAENEGVLLAGVVEDSRGTHLCNTLEEVFPKQKHILQNSRDTDFLYYVMDHGERTCITHYSEKPKEHPTLKDLAPYGEHVYSFYLKTMKNDRPIRVDFLSQQPKRDGKQIASIVYPISAFNTNYGIPAPVIEADQRAKLSQHDLHLVEGKLKSYLDFVGLQTLRRERRPF